MIKIDGSLFIQIVNFLFLIWVLNVVLYRPIRNVLAKREEKVTGLETDISSFSTGATEKDEAYRTGIKDARIKGVQEKEKQVQAAEEEEKEIINKINQQAQANLAAVREKVKKEADDVRSSLLQEVDTFATQISEKILGRRV